MEKSEREREFEITKHYASVLRGHFGWISCHTKSDGSGVHYQRQSDTQQYFLSGNAVRLAGKEIEDQIGNLDGYC